MSRTCLRDGLDFVGDLWSASDERQRREILITTLWSGKVPIRARMTAKPRRRDGQPAAPILERDRKLGTTTPIANVEAFLLCTDPRALSLDIPSNRITISVSDDKRTWGPFDFEPFFPGGATVPTGRLLLIELDDIEFDSTAARCYIAENLLPIKHIPAAKPSAVTPARADHNVIPFPKTGLPGRPSSRNLIEGECRRRYEAGERHPNRAGIESPKDWARVLIDWLEATHKDAPQPTVKTLSNTLGKFLRNLSNQRPTP